MSPLVLTNQHHKAAQLLAGGKLTNADIAKELGITYQTLWNWKQRDEFNALIEANLADYREETRRLGIAVVDRRIRALNDRWNRMQRVIEARADDPKYQDAPGGSTGLLVMTTKKIGHGEDSELIFEFAVDTALLRELREHEKQAAQELGQWVERQSVDQTVKGRVDVASALATLPVHELNALESIAEKLASRPQDAPSEDPSGEV